MYGEPALPPDFDHLPYVNPEAPNGGSVVSAEVGSFDSLNPYILKGTVPWQLTSLVTESLMGRSLDEPFTLYGLLAETIDVPDDRSWVEFQLRPEARFSNGDPVTVEDVIWSYETLGTQGHPRYQTFWAKVESIAPVGDRGIRITFNVQDRELALLAGLRPILQKKQWEGVDFASADGLDIIPITSGPYVVETYDAGRSVTLRRDEDYWGADLPFRRGTMNLDKVRYEFFGDETAAFEAFKSGETNIVRETNVARWESEYDFPLVQDGEVVLSEVPHLRPSGMTGLVMNTRDPLFSDWRVRDAMMLAFNFEFINEAMTGGEQPRITSYYSNSPLGMTSGAAQGKVADYLAKYADSLLPGAMEGYELPTSDGSERNRANVAKAIGQLEAAGWTVGEDGSLRNPGGEPFAFEILLENGSSEVASVVDMYVQSLGRLGMQVTVNSVDSAQYKQRTDGYDFDMTYFRRAVSNSPGNEQVLYWGSGTADEPGGRNLMGVKSPAVDGLIRDLLTAESTDDFTAATQALDRVLTSGRYVIPFYQWNVARIAHAAELTYPERLPLMGDWPGWQPDVWWWEPQE
ncbi:ABC transporter substrate-binding protein [Rubellimicrobium rubrum]|uniref:ABC transporter substrate-binding protein n=2 Tax=Rubellimicrobium rubrum TaxID=2585369 RepID=A0A5C4N0K9_9RHOB|nr:extracellular solute-binding protein [Rubellimicrobium rubrum]TNC51257.1 ABC transporter substrate-binding protein [Rubellimicrobium rubrum]